MTYVVRDEIGRVLATALEEHEAMDMARRLAKRRVEILWLAKDGQEGVRIEPRCQLYRRDNGEIAFTGPLSECREFISFCGKPLTTTIPFTDFAS
jgi:hypothetical protein